MTSKNVLIACLALAVSAAASLPYINLAYEERQVAEHNARHAERVEQYRKDLAEYQAKLAQRKEEEDQGHRAKQWPRTYTKGGLLPDDFGERLEDSEPFEPRLMEVSPYQRSAAPKEAIALAGVTLVFLSSGYYLFAKRGTIWNALLRFKAGWTVNAQHYKFQPVQRFLFYLLAVLAGWQAYKASQYHDERMTVLIGAAIAVGALVLASMKRSMGSKDGGM